MPRCVRSNNERSRAISLRELTVFEAGAGGVEDQRNRHVRSSTPQTSTFMSEIVRRMTLGPRPMMETGPGRGRRSTFLSRALIERHKCRQWPRTPNLERFKERENPLGVRPDVPAADARHRADADAAAAGSHRSDAND